MLKQRLIPSLLLQDGRLVKGIRFRDFRDAGNPATTARAYNAQGADEILLLDIAASKRGCLPDLASIRLIAAECFMPLTVGGGISSLEIAQACMDAGADKLCVNTTALDDPALITRLARRYGRQAVVIGIDALDGLIYDHRTGCRTERLALEWIAQSVALGAGEVRLMSVDREGSRRGLDLGLLHEARKLVSVPIILEGGAGNLEDLQQGLDAGADGVAAGTMLVFSDNNLVKVKRFLAGQNCRMRQ